MARILVVDDEEGVRSFVGEALETEGHDVTLAADGEAALAKFSGDSFDLLITDLNMPKLDGLSLLRQVREQSPDTEVIVLTAHGSIDVAVEAMRLGAFDFVQKPVSAPAELRLLATRALERRALLSLKERASRSDEESPDIVSVEPAMQKVLLSLAKVAKTDATVLLTGESGTGKEVAARFIHRCSPRAAGAFVAVNCAALSEHLLESELFGHEKGAFTGAHALRRGRLELCEGGTFFLDEVGELKPHLQAKLLRVLQERTFERVGGTRTLRADVRWIAATNRDIAKLVGSGGFREDLFHRLSVFPIRLPPLRERRADIPALAGALLASVTAELGRGQLRLAPAALDLLTGASWTGNARELRNVLERAAILTEGSVIGPEHIVLDWVGGEPETRLGAEPRTLEEMEKQAIVRALAKVSGNRKRAAELLGIGVRTLYEKLKKYGIA